jgi:phosphoribosylformimino-5-aminoimidazole carboxamide ribotide isomerase
MHRTPEARFARPILIVPAIDLRRGRCVRLSHGDPNRETAYDEDPVARAVAFAEAGARRIHLVDLDGAFGSGENDAVLRAVCAAVEVPIQTGGGVRSLDDVERRFAAGASYVILGTLLVEEPSVAREILAAHGERIIAGIDARAGEVATRGWLRPGGRDRDALVREVVEWGVARIIFTEIARDGVGGGYDVAALARVAALGRVRVTASGGADSLASLAELTAATPENVDHAIVGRAIYEGTLDLREALKRSADQLTTDGYADAQHREDG